jgi:hypothetical protein
MVSDIVQMNNFTKIGTVALDKFCSIHLMFWKQVKIGFAYTVLVVNDTILGMEEQRVKARVTAGT